MKLRTYFVPKVIVALAALSLITACGGDDDGYDDSQNTNAAPTITSFTPDFVFVNTGGPVTIAGTNFSSTAANNTVTFLLNTNGTIATTGTNGTVTGASSTSLTVTVPTSLAVGTYRIRVSVSGVSTSVTSTADFFVEPTIVVVPLTN